MHTETKFDRWEKSLNMSDNPWISVIIPVYNPGRYFEKCINSILNQTYRNLEIILVDDGSTDGSEKACDDYAQKDNRIKVIHQKNSGVSKARNAGLHIATGDYYHFPDSDDYMEPDSYEYLLGLVEKTKCDVINFEHFITYPDREITHSYPEEFYGACNQRQALGKLAGGVQFCWNKLFSKKLITASGDFAGIKFREDIVRGEDTLFAASAIERTESVWFDQRPLYHYVQTEQSACRGSFRPSQLSVVKLYDAFRPIYGKYQDVWQNFVVFMQGILINIYYDIWSDEKPWREEKKELRQVIETHYQEILKNYPLSKKQRIKFLLFHICPDFFCLCHKIALKIYWRNT